MLIAFNFTRIAVIVRRWFEIGPNAVMEHGARVELRLLTPQPHRGSESAAQKTVIDEAFWRADLFNRLDRPADSFSAAHYHPRFDGIEPGDRVWSTDLTADPWTWLAHELHAIEDRLREAGLDAGLVADDAEDIRAFVPQIVTTARQFSPEIPSTRDEDFHLTRDAAERVRRMLDHIPDPAMIDHDYLKPWIEQS
ncbi:MAG TPA: hypothetical protein VFG87_17515 [Amycolatopsis sp.]|nr:hypothetical protein [Amycolatopsis sp.]